MANGKVLSTVISLGGKVDGSLNKALEQSKAKTSNAAKAMGKIMSNSTKTAGKIMTSSLKSVASGALKIFGVIKSLGKLKDYASESVAAAKAQIDVQTKLTSILQNVKSIQIRGPNAAAEAAENLKNVANNLEKVGVVGDEVVMAGMQQLATYQLSDKEISTLSGGMADLLAQQKGLNASQSDAVSIGNMIGKAMSGNVGALSKVGISFTKAQAAAIKTGDATQRAATIAEVLKDNVGGVNKALGETDQGQLVQAQNTYDDIKEEIGYTLLPLMNQLAKGALPYAKKALEKLSGVLDKVGPILGNIISKGFEKLSAIMPYITQGISGAMPFFKQIISALGKGKGLLPVITGAIQKLLPNITQIVNAIVSLIPQLIEWLIPALESIIPPVTDIINSLLPVLTSLIQNLVPFIGDLINQIAPLVTSVIDALLPAFEALIPPITDIIKDILPILISLFKKIAPFVANLVKQFAPLVTTLLNALIPAFNILIPPIMNLVDSLLPVLQTLFSAIFDVIQSLTPIISFLAEIFSTVLANAINFLTPIIQGIIDHFSNIMKILSSIIDFIVNVFTGNWQAAWDNVKNIFSGVFDTFVNLAKTPLNLVIDLINTAIKGINGLTGIINKIPGVNIGEIPQIPHLAKGKTVYGPTLAMIGEGNVPETVVPHNNSPRSRALLEEAARGVGIKSDTFSYLPAIDKITNGLSYFSDHVLRKPKEKPMPNNPETINGNGKTYKIYFNPVINTKDAEGVKEVLEDEYEKFKAFMKQFMDEEEREVFE